MSTLNDAIQYIRMGNKAEGRQILEELLDVDENNEEVWLWLSSVVDTDDDREICLENALALDPESVVAQKGLEALKSGIFSTDELLRELLVGEDEEEEEEEPVTFLDDFAISDDHPDDDDFGFSDYDDSEASSKKFNPKVLVLGVLVLVLIIVLGVLAVVSMSLLGGDGEPTPDTGRQNQETPANQQQPEATATPADTATPAPTATPTETPTPSLRLPTAKPTDEPTPIATQVVSPTPIKN